nr:MAG TPA: hypothetical protein [Caudoviricetes sp.]
MMRLKNSLLRIILRMKKKTSKQRRAASFLK